MQYDPDKHHRRSIRLKGYDYTSPGAYFITLCTHQRECLFGAVVNGEMQLNAVGQIAIACWQRLPSYFPHLVLDVFIVMPNHIHGILLLTNPGRGEAFGKEGVAQDENHCPNASPLQPRGTTLGEAFGAEGVAKYENHGPNASPLQPRGTTPGSVGAMIQNFKSISAQQINRRCQPNTIKIWQRNYYEHIVRNEESLQHLRQYIQNNPLSWQEDQLHPDVPSKW